MTTDNPTIVERLRSETRTQHDRLEEVAASDKLAEGTLSPEEYLKLLRANYAAHRQLEGLVGKSGEMEALLEERQKTRLLEKDLEQAGEDPERVWQQLRNELPDLALENKYQALGAQYVMEGATLGGVVILKSLNQHPQLQPYQPFHYYGCYGGDTGRRWSQFKQLLLQEVQTPEQQEEALKGTLGAYKLFEKAFVAVQ
ncbi:biliverdin-producing heme oxygenase [Cesiribacter sp. SM1]|uniref:biliverdin-producing heme oxygenase n=1 Tax=Cesiribacter sp. SM1 TaxID=2861196 RepID=UPI001CD704CB|nr:biliverdin-producing heme oxygenase [Cesiribacter sp. SM1]